MDIKKIIVWSLKHWWLYAGSLLLCTIIGIFYYYTAVPKFTVKATLMMRQEDDSKQDEMLRMMGYGSTKSPSDEVVVLSSRDLLGRVIDSLDICTTYTTKKNGKWIEQYPEHDLSVLMLESPVKPVNVEVKICKNAYKVKLGCDKKTKRYKVSSLNQPIHTFVGDIALCLPDSLKSGKFKATIMPRILMVEYYTRILSIARSSRESNIVNLSIVTKCPAKSIAVINALLDMYNQESAVDKNRLAIQTDQFLTSRIEVVTDQLNKAETSLEAYKRNNQIANLASSASNYQSNIESYNEQVIEIDRQLNILDLVEQTMPQFFQSYSLFTGNVGLSDRALCNAIDEYNGLVTRRNSLLQTATVQNAMVKLLDEQINQCISNIQINVAQLRQTLSLRKQFLQEQQNRYDSRLASIPETERRYLIMNRDKNTKEKQYLYLIEKREENAMMLASEVLPAKIIDRAQLLPNRVSPKLSVVFLLILFFGFGLPLAYYFIELIWKEIYDSLRS